MKLKNIILIFATTLFWVSCTPKKNLTTVKEKNKAEIMHDAPPPPPRVADAPPPPPPPAPRRKQVPPPPPPPPRVGQGMPLQAPPSVIEDNVLPPPPPAPALKRKQAPPPPPPAPSRAPEAEIFKVVEEMPRFPGCEEVQNSQERKECAEGKMLAFIYDNLVYPKEAKAYDIEGKCIVSFAVDRSGQLSNIKLLRDLGQGTGEEAVRVIHLMNEEGIRWIPGKQRGQKVRVKYVLPIRFKL